MGFLAGYYCSGVAESNGSLPPGLTHATRRLTAKNRDQLWNPTLGNRVWATFYFLLLQHYFVPGCGKRSIITSMSVRVCVSVCLSAYTYLLNYTELTSLFSYSVTAFKL